ncbi:MAG: hypothetical protein Q4G26_16145 [Paracoccus sp. (in: a-proteobacteria)]|nr:hypothetical protein [Paracoccus sp. (in: a-proteobacteria)]
MRAELRADAIDDLPLEALLADLVQRPLLVVAQDVLPGQVSEAARCVLMEMRDTLNDYQLATGLRFTVEGTILRRVTSGAMPDVVMIGTAPAVGPGHEGDYQQIAGVA